MSNLDGFNQFFENNRIFFDLFNDMPIKGILRSVWNKKGAESQKEIEALQLLLLRIKTLKGEAEAKVESRNLELKRRQEINSSIVNQQDFYLEEINELKKQKKIAVDQINIINTRLSFSEKERSNLKKKYKYVTSLESAVSIQKKALTSIQSENKNLYKQTKVLSHRKQKESEQNEQQYLQLQELKKELSNNQTRIKELSNKNDQISILKINIIKQNEEIDQLKVEKLNRKNELEQLLYEKEELSSYAKNYKKLNNKLSNEVFRLSQLQ